MLDLAKLAKQIPGISKYMKEEAAASRQRLQRAIELLSESGARQQELVEIQENWGDRLIFAAATPVENLDTHIQLHPPPPSHSVFATDGSQISPSHHEITYCYLINIGRVMLHYGQNLYPLLDSMPEVYYKPEDLYVAKNWGIRLEEWMGYRRTVAEAQMLAEMACHWVNPPGAHQDTPNLAMVDGSLILWFIESLPLEAREQILPPILAAYSELKRTKIPLMGYLSASRSMEAVNFLRFAACTYPTPNCVVNCSGVMEKLPCQVTDPLRDASLWANMLEIGERGPLWRSNLRILDAYDESQRVYFCYVNVGHEIARIEVPEWVATDLKLFEQSLSIMLAQVYKGYGYPVALAEAHNRAVVRGADRARFFALLEQQMIRAGLKNVGISYKESSKRGSIA
ncbi:MAG: DNA double-strand break repair nuclease NurA [Gomphosphaeria aponina SAG 52.96 = DSM 107014]|uniref:DNA double-strand break repair nuclease NurA n=1 Tax=Gomphosphaeria aponina SAG 52.96 = DSM 107014 TaxID=1521640 RepID=A0A941GRP6_9CHRO|nr:DNA double-strand break repair nuclease NurA [Gomphosphaeria aponina SAG 52.96 = DSM 107014]